ncbi:MAG: hypothetical protein H7Z16_05090 [Pyrinomonadaceae bacterium]|nr:hypothetical protein [Pyrinomonadaceae bacterium]
MPSVRSLALLPLSLLLFTLLSMSCRTGNQSNQNGGGPSPAPSPGGFVLAWTAPNRDIKTAESADGLTWLSSNPRGTTTDTSLGPAIAHDGQLAWMLMWNDGTLLRYTVGLGIPTATERIVWSSSIERGPLSNTEGSPALAFGGTRYVAVTRVSGGRLMVIRSDANSANSWESSPTPVVLGATPPAIANGDPALAFGTVGGLGGVFVLAFQDSSFNIVTATSPDGLTWSAPTIILGRASAKDPSLTVGNGIVFALLAAHAGAGIDNFIFSSVNGVTWTQVNRSQQAPLNRPGPGLAFGVFRNGTCLMLLIEPVDRPLTVGMSSRVATPAAPCRPANLAFTNPVGIRAVGQTTDEHSDSRVAITFGTR